MGLGLGLCCCGSPCDPIANQIVAIHDGIYWGMHAFQMGIGYTFGASVPIGDPFRSAPNTIVFLPDAVDTYTRGAKADGFNAQIILANDYSTPNGAYTYELHDYILSITISKGADSVVYEWDAASNTLIRNEIETTIDVCLSISGLVTYLAARLFEETVAVGAYEYTTVVSGFAGSAACLAINGSRAQTLLIGGGSTCGTHLAYVAKADGWNGLQCRMLAGVGAAPLQTANLFFTTTGTGWGSHFSYSSYNLANCATAAPCTPTDTLADPVMSIIEMTSDRGRWTLPGSTARLMTDPLNDVTQYQRNDPYVSPCTGGTLDSITESL